MTLYKIASLNIKKNHFIQSGTGLEALANIVFQTATTKIFFSVLLLIQTY